MQGGGRKRQRRLPSKKKEASTSSKKAGSSGAADRRRPCSSDRKESRSTPKKKMREQKSDAQSCWRAKKLGNRKKEKKQRSHLLVYNPAPSNGRGGHCTPRGGEIPRSLGRTSAECFAGPIRRCENGAKSRQWPTAGRTVRIQNALHPETNRKKRIRETLWALNRDRK